MTGLNGISALTNFSSVNVNPASAVSAHATAGTSGTSAATTAVITDHAKVSSTGSLVAQALSTSDVRHEKVSQLQEAIANGTYSVSSDDVASKMIDSLLR